jgi:putative spermidine/putrescine transport system permease protein
MRPRTERWVVGALCLAVLAAMLAPIAIVAVMSLTAGSSLQFPPPGFSLRWYESLWALLTDRGDISRFRESLLTSLSISALVMVISGAAGAPAAYALQRFDLPGRRLIEALLALPLVFPLVVLGVALLVIASLFGLEWGIARIVTAHVTLTLPFVIRNVMAAMAGVPRSHEEAARVLGASPLRTAVEIVLPGIRSGIVAGMLLAFVISFNEFTVAYFLYTVDVFPLSIWIFSKSNTVLDPTIFSISTLVIALDVILIILLDQWTGEQGVSL